ncbi:hypothetical protein HS5_16590 [Acidianus sp. HS-5]|nr:hypothetical protein HS5_16590 [Acidianus sp. HS-5]
MTEGNIFEGVDNLIERVELTFVNTTPWWGGNEFGYTFDDDGNVTVPSANEIVGRTKWLMRNIIAQILGINGFDNIDERFLKELGTLDNKSKITVRVTAYKGEKQSFYFTKKEAYRVFKIIKDKKLNSKFNIIINDEFDTITAGLKEVSESIVEYLRYFSIPRFFLAHMNRDDPLFYYHNQPAKPKSVRIKVELINNGVSDELFDFFKSSLIFTMKYMGIGKAATRGFGRFALENDWKFELNQDLNELLLLGKNITNSGIIGEIPPCEISVEKIENPCLYNYKKNKYEQIIIKDPITYLIAIGVATLKEAWETSVEDNCAYLSKMYPIWPLGLPRSDKQGLGYLIKDETKEDPGRRISYITISPICNGDTCSEIYLIPFIYGEDEFRKIELKGKSSSSSIPKFGMIVPGQGYLNPSNNVRDYVYATMSWLKFILGGGCHGQ